MKVIQIVFYNSGLFCFTHFDVFDKLSNLYGVDMSVFFEENMDDFQQSLVCAFRTDGITPEDMHTIAKFKSIVNNYLKMCNLLK